MDQLKQQKFILIFSIIIFFAEASEIRKVKGVEGQIKSIEFDLDYNNTYVVSYHNESEYLYKLDSKQEIILYDDFLDVLKVLINSENDVYVFSYDEHEHMNIWILPKNSIAFKKLTMYDPPDFDGILEEPFLDNEDNIFINTKYGVAFLRPNQNIVLAVSNLESKYFSQYLVDDSGDVYLKVNKKNYDPHLRTSVVITNEAKKESVPFATVVDHFKGEVNPFSSLEEKYNTVGTAYSGKLGTYFYSSTHWTLDDKYNPIGDVYYRGEFVKEFIAKLSKVNDEHNKKILLVEYGVTYEILYETNNRLFLTSQKFDKNFFNVYFITKNDEVVAIKELFYGPLINSSRCAADKNDNAFFGHEQSVVLVKNDETDSRKIDIRKDDDHDISLLLMDKNDNLWVLAKDLYVIRNNTETAIKVSSLPEGANPMMKENKMTNEILVASRNGLYVCKT